MDDIDKRWRTAMDDVGKKPAQTEAANLREVSEEELQQILAAHKTWLETDGQEGKQAFLDLADLQGADLFRANLRGADLPSANLQAAYLRSANLPEANFPRANLESANLPKAKSLTREQLDEACGDDETKLPDYLAFHQMKACPTSEQPPSN